MNRLKFAAYFHGRVLCFLLHTLTEYIVISSISGIFKSLWKHSIDERKPLTIWDLMMISDTNAILISMINFSTLLLTKNYAWFKDLLINVETRSGKMTSDNDRSCFHENKR